MSGWSESNQEDYINDPQHFSASVFSCCLNRPEILKFGDLIYVAYLEWQGKALYGGEQSTVDHHRIDNDLILNDLVKVLNGTHKLNI